ncbi:MAG: sulfatase, partial [Actinomycetota bacterium]|nr:sulfatase [Actinomycetota bacterium]
LVLVDDMRTDDLARMPATNQLLVDNGTSFPNAYATFPLCCPSRASILTGQYPHNTGVRSNRAPLGGFSRFDDSNTLATWLDNTGYATGYLGKYLNQYVNFGATYVPPGWDQWEAIVGGLARPSDPQKFNVNGVEEVRPGHQTDILTERAIEFLSTHADHPMFLHLAYTAPHQSKIGAGWGPPLTATRHEHGFDGLTAPMGPAYNEEDITDKPAALQQPLLEESALAYTHALAEGRAESLLAVDEGVQRIVDTLQAAGELDSTYFVFASDNGFMLGEHRRRAGKVEHYEESSGVPLVIRGPEVPLGSTDAVVGLHDLAPTILGVTQSWGAVTDFVLDGRDLLPLAQDPSLPADRDLLIQARRPLHDLDYFAIRSEDGWKYVRYAGGAVEMYNLNADPHELDNLAGKERFATVEQDLQQRLTQIEACSGDACR